MKQEPASLTLSERLSTAYAQELAKDTYKGQDPELAYVAAGQALLQRENAENIVLFDRSNPGDQMALALLTMEDEHHG
jgi:hypothetical protein